MCVKKGINYWEFRDGYGVSTKADVLQVIAGYREGRLRRKELRVFAGRLERKALHKKSRVDLARILNCRSGAKGVRRLRMGEIKGAGEILDTSLSAARGAVSPCVIVSRKVLRHIAQGRCTSTEAVVLFYYMVRRIRQVKPLRRLKPGERYARFTYRELERVSGIPRANISRAVSRLKDRGWINTVDVAKSNENAYGQLFVDGALIALVGVRRPVNKRVRKAVDKPVDKPVDKCGPRQGRGEQNDNTPLNETTTLKKKYNPKTQILSVYRKSQEEQRPKITFSAEFERIKRRAEQMKAELMEQAA